MNIKLTSVIVALFALNACATAPTPARENNVATDTALSEASYSVSRSIANLSEVAQASHPLPKLDPPPNPETYGMGGVTSVDWSGPVEPLVKQLASAANYRMNVLGTAPAIPVLVTVSAKNSMLADVLRDVGYQCGRRANIIVYPETRVVELRYAKN